MQEDVHGALHPGTVTKEHTLDNAGSVTNDGPVLEFALVLVHCILARLSGLLMAFLRRSLAGQRFAGVPCEFADRALGAVEGDDVLILADRGVQAWIGREVGGLKSYQNWM